MKFSPDKIRAPVWDGQFYPAAPATLRKMVEDFLQQAKPPHEAPVKAIIAPHAGYIYSGSIAGSAFAAWRTGAAAVRRVVLLGPAHRVPFEGLALSTAEAFATPLGALPIDPSGATDLAGLPQVHHQDTVHAYEHCLEVEIPFLQVLFPECLLLPLVIGEATPVEVAEVMDRLWGGEGTRFVISSDLSHYLSYEQAQAMDQATARTIENLEPESLTSQQACGCQGIQGLLHAARKHHLQAATVDLRNSGDTSGSRHRVVGYGAFWFTEATR